MNKNGIKYRIIRENKNEFSVYNNSLRLYLAHKSGFLSRKFLFKDTFSGRETMRSVRTAAGNWLITRDDATCILSMRLDQWSQRFYFDTRAGRCRLKMNELQCNIKNEKTGAIIALAEYARGVDTLIISTEDEHDKYVEQSFLHTLN
ncbi:hypothetical protein E3Q10_03130 [Wallemia mellicola]|uniref:Uncharacterized protein n=1 Tax=Wallemia mellicola TaxID=1708541 RepID=A0A4T0QVU0_9BASI|nr:hypothetical protein E3Q10_03130 [Wallemia mellicola]